MIKKLFDLKGHKNRNKMEHCVNIFEYKAISLKHDFSHITI